MGSPGSDPLDIKASLLLLHLQCSQEAGLQHEGTIRPLPASLHLLYNVLVQYYTWGDIENIETIDYLHPWAFSINIIICEQPVSIYFAPTSWLIQDFTLLTNIVIIITIIITLIIKTIISSNRSSYSDDGLLYVPSHFFRFSLSPLMQLMLKVSLKVT